ncbi:hypothetical protein, partial [Ramlibacter sp.]|uniref:hypothetical protein n=1 Tax=Ramlibacter sp. TaxID=1917967 RepID=UPI002D1B1922
RLELRVMRAASARLRCLRLHCCPSIFDGQHRHWRVSARQGGMAGRSRRIGDRRGEAGKRETRAKRVWHGVWHLVRRPYVLGVGVLVVGTYALNPLYEETLALGSMGEITVPTRHVIFTTDAPMLVGDYVFTLLWQIALFGFLYWKARR